MMVQDHCRLCSSEKNLISMFSGKSRVIRDFLRKMIQYTVDVQIEYGDSVPSVCFNCSIDVCNFYFFKLHCLQNEEQLKDVQAPVCTAKKLKLEHLDLKDIERPDLESTEKVLKWLSSKRIKLVETAQTCTSEVTQTIQTYCSVATQWDPVETHSKNCQTTQPKLINSEIQCDIINLQLPSTISVTTQTYSKDKEKNSKCTNCIKVNRPDLPKKNNKNHQTQTINLCYEKSSQTKNCKIANRLSQTDNNFEHNLQDRCCQTEACNMINSFSQTTSKKLTSKLYQHNIVPEVDTRDSYAQTEFLEIINQCAHCDAIKLSSYKTSLWQTKVKTVSPKDRKNIYKITDSQTFNDALLNGFDNIFVSKAIQTDSTTVQCEQFNHSHGYFEGKDSYLLSPNKNSFSKEINQKLSIKVSFPEKVKDEKISPTESLSISTTQSPNKHGLLSPQSSDLLQVNKNKSDSVKICKLCDMTLYNKKEVMLHNKTHLQCKICKRKFRSLKATEIHIKDCKVMQTNISPIVNLVRIDQIPEIKNKYFKDFQ